MRLTRFAAACGCFFSFCVTIHAQVPQLINYQGRVVAGSSNFNGTGSFKFALVNTDGSTTYWGNDGTSSAGSEPAKAVSLSVSNGLYSILLGDTSLANMTVIPNGVFNNPDVRLRVWFDDGTHGSQQLTPDQRIASVGYAQIAANAGVVAVGAENTALGYQAFFSNTDGNFSTATGFQALYSNTTGTQNTADGDAALQNNTTGNNNTATGVVALQSNTTGNDNTAVGAFAMQANTTGSSNTATGLNALRNNTTANDNTATGDAALFMNTTGTQNTATGNAALFSNTIGSNNVADGWTALHNNTTGNYNTATGWIALYNNTTAGFNTATGYAALSSNTTGEANSAFGFEALRHSTTGKQNTATGLEALFNNTTADNNTANGFFALLNNTTGSRNIALGFVAGVNLTTGNDNIDIGNVGLAGESSTIRLGEPSNPSPRTFIAGIRGITTGAVDAIPVVIDSNSQLGTVGSSRRFKKDIKPMDQTSEAILALKPVTFHYKSDAKGTPQFGLIAEEVAKVNPALVARDADGEVYSVRYEAVNAMLLNEFLKEHRKVKDQQGTITDLKSNIAKQQKQIEALTAAVQKVSNRVELSKARPQMVTNNDR